MQSNNKITKKKKRKLKPFVKVIIFLIFLSIIFGTLYKFNLIKPTQSFFQKTYTDIKSLISKKDTDSSLETDDVTDNSLLSIFKKRLPSQNLVFASSTLMDNGDIKIFLKNTKNDSGYLFVNTKDNGEEIWTTFASVAIAEPIKSILTNDLFNLDYIDLRFRNKVFYKVNGSNTSASTSVSLTNQNSTTSTTIGTSSNIILNHQ